jgi:protocatechuate 3,4-dioxygenase beta subunit
MVAMVVVTVLAVSELQLLAAGENDKPAKAETPAAGVAEKEAEKGRTWQGQVVERGTFKPIAGVEVVITLSADEIKARNEPEYRRKVTCTTKDDGTYEFTVLPEEAARPHLYIEASIKTPDHPEYYGGYGYGLILKNEKLGVGPFFKRLILWPGRKIEGIVKTPEGQPAEGVKVMAYISPTPNKPNPWARFPSTKTDKEGRFQLIVHEKVRSVLWILPQDYAPEVHNVTNEQHDLGTYTLTKGERLTGKLLDSEGQPVAGVYVEASAVKANPEGKNPLVPHHVANHIRRTTMTAADGSFEFRPLPARKYEIQPTESSWDTSTSERGRDAEVKKPLPAVFISKTVILKKGGTSVEFKAVPHVVMEAQRLNSRGEKREGSTIHLIGSLGDDSWMTSAESSPTGEYRILVPKGLSGASISLIYDPDSAFQYRLKKDAPLQYSRHFRLGDINQDLKGVEIIHYAAPTIVISVTDKDGKPVQDLLPSVDYTDPKYDGRGDKLYHQGKSGESRTDVPFENIGDGKIRTIQLVPDREVDVTIEAEGFKSESRKITLAEGKTEEMKFVLEPK